MEGELSEVVDLALPAKALDHRLDGRVERTAFFSGWWIGHPDLRFSEQVSSPR
jgi:hypothetical protein